MYDTVEEAQMRLAGTVVLYDGQPAYIRGITTVGRQIVAQVESLPRLGNGFIVPLSDEKLNFREYRQSLGYINNMAKGDGTRIALYMSRIPIRGAGYRQGLCSHNLTAMYEGRQMPYGFSNTIITPQFKDMMLGIYPSLQEAIKILDDEEDQSVVAFNQKFAIEIDRGLELYYLHFKGERVGHGGVNEFVLPSGSSHLAEMIRESGVNIRNV